MINSKKYISYLVGVSVITMLAACHYGTGSREKIYTPIEQLYKVEISHADYAADSLKLHNQLRQLLKGHEESFYSKEYFDSTQIIIDTIVYNTELDKLATFVITKNPTYRQRSPDKTSEWYYDATCYLGLKERDTILLSWIGPNFSNSMNINELSEIIRDACFTGFARKDTTNGGLYQYNLNDKRFWDGPIWKKNFKPLR